MRHTTKQRNTPLRAGVQTTTRVEREPDDAEQTQKKMLCRLTLELSGGGAVRLNDLLGRRPAPPKYGCTIALLLMAGNALTVMACANRTSC